MNFIMKIKNIIYATTLTAIMIGAGTGCSKDKFDINANPDDVTDVSVTPSVILPRCFAGNINQHCGGILVPGMVDGPWCKIWPHTNH
jgi:hypothetical protein